MRDTEWSSVLDVEVDESVAGLVVVPPGFPSIRVRGGRVTERPLLYSTVETGAEWPAIEPR